MTIESAHFLRGGGDQADLSVGFHREHDERCLVGRPIREREPGQPMLPWNQLRCALDFTCPTCRADIGSACRSTASFEQLRTIHGRRRKAAQLAPWPTSS